MKTKSNAAAHTATKTTTCKSGSKPESESQWEWYGIRARTWQCCTNSFSITAFNRGHSQFIAGNSHRVAKEHDRSAAGHFPAIQRSNQTLRDVRFLQVLHQVQTKGGRQSQLTYKVIRDLHKFLPLDVIN